MPVNNRSAPSASEVSVVLISPQLCVPGSRDSRNNWIISRILQKLRKKRAQKLRVTSSHACVSGP